MLDLPSYLARINYSGPNESTAKTLRALHHAHLLAVPFENLDIALGRKIITDEDAILNKIVTLRRGGFCYELNYAFAALLRALGFHVTLLSARVARSNGEEGPEFDHLALRVDLGEPWLADVGFGESFLEPLRLANQARNREKSNPIPQVCFASCQEASAGRWKNACLTATGSRNTLSLCSHAAWKNSPPCATTTRRRLSPRSRKSAFAAVRLPRVELPCQI